MNQRGKAHDGADVSRVRRIGLGIWAAFMTIVAAGALVSGVPLSSLQSDPRAAGMGGAYAALASGPLAPLWNPAGIAAVAGVQAAASGVFGGEGPLLLGATVVADGTGAAWDQVENGSSHRLQGSVALTLRPGLAAGGAVAFDSSEGASQIALAAGLLGTGEAWSVGVSLANWGPGRSAEFLLGLRVTASPWLDIEGDLHLLSSGDEVALGGDARLWAVDLRWGVTLGTGGGLLAVGVGCGLSLFGQELDLALVLHGADLGLVLVAGFEARIPAWW